MSVSRKWKLSLLFGFALFVASVTIAKDSYWISTVLMLISMLIAAMVYRL